MKKVFINSLLLLLSVLFALLAGEGISRIVFSPGDYLQPEIFRDEWGARVKPDTTGHDSWGFRNEKILYGAEIAVIGDSNTYGVAAIGGNSWPSQLGRITGKTVYNLGMPGYGPVTYDHLLKDYALELKPAMVIVGYYVGNDAWGAYKAVYRFDHSPHLKDPDFDSGVFKDRWDIDTEDEVTPLPLARARWWLSHNSVLYNLARYFRPFRLLQNRIQGKGEAGYSILNSGAGAIHTALQPKGLRAVNLDNLSVREGLRISLRILTDMDQLCRERSIDFLVVLIPTKISVYSGYITEETGIEHYDELLKCAENERKMNKLIRSYLKEHGIAFLDTLVPLRKATQREEVYPDTGDTHPNRYGYGVIARTVADYLAGRRRSLRKEELI